MKTYLTKAIAFAIIITSCFSCSIESIDDSTNAFTINDSVAEDLPLDPCVGESPKARLTNNGTITFDLEIYNLSGELLSYENNITPGEISSWQTLVSDETVFSVSNTLIPDDKVMYTMNTCMVFEMEIGPDNKLTGAVPVQL